MIPTSSAVNSSPPTIMVSPGRDLGSSLVSLPPKPFMLVDHPILLVTEKKRAVSENYTGWRFEAPRGIQGEILEEAGSLIVGSYSEVDEQDRVTGIPVGSPRTICR